MKKSSSSYNDAAPAQTRGAVTMATVGRMAGVSQVTVSRALSDPTKVSPDTLRRIRDAIEATGFVPNAIAGALASRKSQLITALVPSITNIVYSSLLHGFSDLIREHGYQMMVSETGFDPQQETDMIATHLARRPDGMLLTGIHHSPAARRMLIGAAIPVVEIWDITETPIDRCVGFSHAQIGLASADYALAQGHRHAATITACDARAQRRRDGFVRRFAAETGADIRAIDFPPGTATLGHGRQAMAQLLDQGFRGLVYCSSDQCAHGALIEARARGLDVPGDIAVIGFGDQDFAEHTLPPLTTVKVDRDAMGKAAATALLGRIGGQNDAPTTIDVGFQIVTRGSA